MIKILTIQKQLFGDALQNRCSKKFRKFHRKTLLLESLFHPKRYLISPGIFQMKAATEIIQEMFCFQIL